MPQPAASVKISSLLNRTNIVFIDSEISKGQAIEQLAVIVAADSGVPAAEIIEKISQRELGIATTLETGLSVPHARMPGLKGIRAAFALFPRGLKDSRRDAVVIRAMFLFISPSEPDFFNSHLKLLSVLSSTFQPLLVDSLLSLGHPDKIALALARLN